MAQEERKVKSLIRIFEDDTAEILEGESLTSFLDHERAALSLLLSHSWAAPKTGEIKWVPVKEVKITRE